MCVPYSGDVSNPCNRFYVEGEDKVYIPSGSRAGDNIDTLNSYVVDAEIFAALEILNGECK